MLGKVQNKTKENKMFFKRKNKIVWKAWLRKKREATNKTILAVKMGKPIDRGEMKNPDSVIYQPVCDLLAAICWYIKWKWYLLSALSQWSPSKYGFLLLSLQFPLISGSTEGAKNSTKNVRFVNY